MTVTARSSFPKMDYDIRITIEAVEGAKHVDVQITAHRDGIVLGDRFLIEQGPATEERVRAAVLLLLNNALGPGHA